MTSAYVCNAPHRCIVATAASKVKQGDASTATRAFSSNCALATSGKTKKIACTFVVVVVVRLTPSLPGSE